MTSDASSTEAGESRQAGFALVPALWLLALLAALVASFTNAARLQVRASANLVRNAEAEALADGAARLVAFRLSAAAGEDAGAADSLPRNGATFHCAISLGAVAAVSVQDQSGLVDLNAAPPALIEWALTGIAPGRAARLSAAIADFRDADDDASPGGGEAPDYAAAGLPLGPKNGPFESVLELDQVLGFDAATLRAARGRFTVHSRTDGIDPRVAPESGGPPTEIGEEFVRASRQSHFGLLVAAETEAGGRFKRRAVIEVLRRPDLPFRILEWRRDPDEEWPAPGAPAAPPAPCTD